MIILDNYSKKSTCIVIRDSSYSVCKENEVELIRHGEGGFSEDGELVGAYVYQEKFFFLYKNKAYEVNSQNIKCTNTYVDDKMRRFIVKIENDVICDITYKPFIDPLFLVIDGEEDEFDVLLHLSKILKNRESILNFIKGVYNLNHYYHKF